MNNILKESGEFGESGESRESGIKRWCAAAMLLGCGLILAGCSGASGDSSEVSNPGALGVTDGSVRGWLDRVEGKPRMGGTVNLVGWAAADGPETRIEEIEILLDGIEIAETAEGVERSDVADSYGKPNWSKCGWETEVVLETVLPGEHKIEAVARDSSGARYSLSGARSIVVLDSR